MARKVFISFRYSDGNKYKDELVDLFDESTEIIDVSEDVDRSDMTDDTIRKHLYKKLGNSSVTIIIVTPEAVNHNKWLGVYNDWMHDEIRYSLEDREGNRCNGLIAVYTDDAEHLLITKRTHICDKCRVKSTVNRLRDVNNLFRKNMCNIKPEYKKNECVGIYDGNYDSYCSLISWDDFVNNYKKYIDIAAEKREKVDEYKLKKNLNKD